METYDVVVIGAGAAGLIAAGRASQCGARVLLLEKMPQEGRKMRISGKGRCNITNDASIAEFVKHVHPAGNFLKPALSGFYNQDIIALLNQQQVETVLERGGRYFPKSNKAADVVHALVNWAKEQGVGIRLNCKFEELLTENQQVQGVLYSENGQQKQVGCGSVIVCTGGYSYPATGSNGDGHLLAKKLGHSIEAVRPALVPVEVEETLAKNLSGLNLRNVKASVWSNQKKQADDFGEVTFAEWGLTGPIILTLSRLMVDELRAGNQVSLSIDLKPALSEQTLDARLLRDIDANGKMPLAKLFKLWLPMQLIEPFLSLLALDASKPANQLSSADRRRIRILMKDWRFKVIAYRPFKEAIVTAGGIRTSEINTKTMESKLIKNLYFAGEIIDVDADTGGYNLQIAFSTGWLAGNSSYSA
ncbi:MAG: NAD(P)/FAD-dependent oxidoreductase [Salinivirgaceae bacterium]